MLENITKVMASDPACEPDAMRFLYAQAERTKDTSLLEALARNPELPSDLVEKFTKSKTARVMVAWLTRPDITKEQLMRAANDKRVTVAATIAATAGLGPEVYRAVFTNHSENGKVLQALLRNSDVPVDVLYQALAAVVSVPEESSYRANYVTHEVLRSIAQNRPSLINKLVMETGSSKVAPQFVGTLVEAPNLTPDAVRILEKRVLAGLKDRENRDTGRYYYSGHTWNSAALTLLGFTDTSAQFYDEVVKSSVGDQYFHRRVKDVYSRRTPRPVINEHVSSEVVDRILMSSMTLLDRFAAVRDHDLNDSDYVRALCDNGTYRTSHPDAVSPEKLKTAVCAQIAVHHDNALRVAAIASRVPYSMVPWDQVDADLAVVCKHLSVLTTEYFTAYPHDWLFVLARTGLTDEMTFAIPANLVASKYYRTSTGEIPDFHRHVGAYLWQQLGDDPSAWSVFETFLNANVDVTIGDAVQATLSALGR